MQASGVEVPLWLVTAIVGLLGLGLVGGLRIGARVVLEMQGLRQLLIGYDGKNGIRGDLRLLDATVENLGRDVQELRVQVEVDAGKIEQLERDRGLAA
jgi:hypothetical protein